MGIPARQTTGRNGVFCSAGVGSQHFQNFAGHHARTSSNLRSSRYRDPLALPGRRQRARAALFLNRAGTLVWPQFWYASHAEPLHFRIRPRRRNQLPIESDVSGTHGFSAPRIIAGGGTVCAASGAAEVFEALGRRQDQAGAAAAAGLHRFSAAPHLSGLRCWLRYEQGLAEYQPGGSRNGSQTEPRPGLGRLRMPADARLSPRLAP